MKPRYNLFNNNCQTFCINLLNEICSQRDRLRTFPASEWEWRHEPPEPVEIDRESKVDLLREVWKEMGMDEARFGDVLKEAESA
jgi:hypothetical protein